MNFPAQKQDNTSLFLGTDRYIIKRWRLVLLLVGVVALFVFTGASPKRIHNNKHYNDIVFPQDIQAIVEECPIDIALIVKVNSDARDTDQKCVSKLFRYHGGHCNPNLKNLEGQVCIDYANAIRTENEEGFVVVRDVLGYNILFQQWISLRGFFKIDMPYGFENDIHNVTIYGSETMMQETMIQTFLMEAPCGNMDPSFMLQESVGGIQLMASAMDKRVSNTKSQVQVQIKSEGTDGNSTTNNPLTLLELQIASNMDSFGWLNLTDRVLGRELHSGQQFVVEVDGGIASEHDHKPHHHHAMLVTAKGVFIQSDKRCIMTKHILA